MTANTSSGLRFGLWVVLHMTLHLIFVLVPVIQKGAPTFVSYYTASWLMVNREFTVDAYDNVWFAEQTRRVTGDPRANDIIVPNLPTVGFAALPLLALNTTQARLLFLAGSWLASWAALALLVWVARPARGDFIERIWLAGGTLPGWSAPFAFNLESVQIYGYILLGFVAIWLALRRGWDVMGGAILGLLFMLKSAGTSLFILPLLYGRKWFWVGQGIAMTAIFLLSLVWIEPQVWAEYLRVVTLTGSDPTLTVTAFQTTLGFLSHLMRFDSIWNPYPVVNLPSLIRPVYLIVTGAAVVLTVWTIRRASASLTLGMALLVALGVISVPFAEEHHFVVVLFSLVVIVAAFLELDAPRKVLISVLLGGVCVALLFPLPYEHPRLAVGWWSLLAYPRLYGTWLLWAIGCWLAWQRTIQTAPERDPEWGEE